MVILNTFIVTLKLPIKERNVSIQQAYLFEIQSQSLCEVHHMLLLYDIFLSDNIFAKPTSNDIFVPDLLETLFLMANFVSGRKTR